MDQSDYTAVFIPRVGNYIRDYLKANDLTQEAFAFSVGVSQTMVGHWVCHRNPVLARHALAVEKATKGALKKEFLVFGVED